MTSPSTAANIFASYSPEGSLEETLRGGTDWPSALVVQLFEKEGVRIEQSNSFAHHGRFARVRDFKRGGPEHNL